KARFEFVLPSLSSDPAERERSFERFRELANRRHEPWVLEALGFLNHPLHEDHGRRFIRPSLEMLREIQRTGDIFFPSRWTPASLADIGRPRQRQRCGNFWRRTGNCRRD